MKRRTLGITCLVLVLSGAVGLFSAYAGDQNVKREREAARSIPDITAPEDNDYMYVLRLYNGNAAVFLKGSSEPEMVLDVPVRTLPEADQRALMDGIAVKDYQSLVLRIEDYIS